MRYFRLVLSTAALAAPMASAQAPVRTILLLTATDTITLTTNQARDFLVMPASVGSRLELPTLIFAQGKYTMLPASFTELNRLATTLTDNPTVNIRLEGHTDNQGSAKANMELSESRVEAVKKYLVSKGIAKDRVKTKALGGSQPLANEMTQEARAMNRRVEMRVLKD